MWIMVPQGEGDKTHVLFLSGLCLDIIDLFCYRDGWGLTSPISCWAFQEGASAALSNSSFLPQVLKAVLEAASLCQPQACTGHFPIVSRRFGGASRFLHTIPKSSPLFVWGCMDLRYLILKEVVFNKSMIISWKPVALLQVHFRPLCCASSSWRPCWA